MAIPVLGAALPFLAGWFARFLGAATIRLVIWKSLIWTLVISIFPTLLYNFLSELIEEFYGIYTSQAGAHGVAPFVYQLTGMAGWLAVHLKLAESFSIIISAAMFRIAISMIPFVGKW